MARNQANTSQARELTEAELDAVSGGTKTNTQQEPVHEDMLNVVAASY